MKRFFEKHPCLIQMALPLVLAVCITVLAVLIQPNSFLSMGYRFLTQPLLFCLNILPVLLLLCFFKALCDSTWFGAAITNVLICGLSLASRIKVNTRDEALMPRDFLLLREVGEALNSYNIDFPWFLLGLVLAVTVVLVILGIRDKKHRTRKRKAGWRIVWAVVSMVILVVLTLTLFASDDIYYSFRCTNSYYIARTYNEYGMPYSFFHNFTTNPVDCPEEYDSAEAKAWDSGEKNTDGPQVHLIMIMSEAFTDLTDLDMFSYTEENDPLAFYHSLQEDPNALSGYLVVPNFGGGTSNTEFDVMTGMQTDSISTVTTTSFHVVTQNTDSLFRVYNDAGYETGYIHPGYTWFYNRQNVLARLGAQSALFYEDMEDKDMKGTWVTDDYVMDQLIAAFEETVSQGKMLYNYTTTVQNHMAYTADKYGDGYVFAPVETELDLSAEASEVLSVYVEGLRDADRSLEKIVSYFSTTEEPVVLAFWGDHYPNLGNGLTYYKELGLIDNMELKFRYYATPYVIWANDAAAETLDWENAAKALELPENGYLSSCYLGSTLLELCGRGESAPWVSFLNELRRELPLVWNNECYFDGEGNLLYELSEKQQALISKWRCWSYYKLTEQKIAD